MRIFLKELVIFILAAFLLLGGMIGLNTIKLAPNYTAILYKTLYSLLVIACTWFAMAMVKKQFYYMVDMKPELKNAFYFIYRLLLSLIVILGILVLLDGLGIKTAPLLGFLGLGGLATALAIQDTMVNFISGIYILLEKRVQIGDRVKSGDKEGKIVKIGWRTTYLKGDDGEIIIIPNRDISQNVFINYDLGKREENFDNEPR